MDPLRVYASISFKPLTTCLVLTTQKNYAGGRRTTDELLPQMARLAALHGVGVLVIDEINRLSGTRAVAPAKMLNFFVQLTEFNRRPRRPCRYL